MDENPYKSPEHQSIQDRSLEASLPHGEEIVAQLYHFDLHDRHLALRAELTPSIARMVIARAGALRFPVRWFCIGQNWRYERMSRGRTREHYQWNVDIWGEPGVEAEAELRQQLRPARRHEPRVSRRRAYRDRYRR